MFFTKSQICSKLEDKKLSASVKDINYYPKCSNDNVAYFQPFNTNTTHPTPTINSTCLKVKLNSTFLFFMTSFLIFTQYGLEKEVSVRCSLVEQVMVVLSKERPLLATERKLTLSFDRVVLASIGFNFNSHAFNLSILNCLDIT